MNVFREIWYALTYRTGGELPPPRPVPKRPAPRPEVIEAELLMLEVDRAGKKIRIAAVRKERKQS
jgi:hypothetical protein